MSARNRPLEARRSSRRATVAAAAALGAVLLTAAACTVPAASNSPDSVTVQTGNTRNGGSGAGSDIARKHCNAWGKTPARSGETARNGSEDQSYTCQ